MKRKLLQTTLLLLSYFASAQFTIKVESPKDFLFDNAKMVQYLLPSETPLEQGLKCEWEYMKERI